MEYKTIFILLDMSHYPSPYLELVIPKKYYQNTFLSIQKSYVYDKKSVEIIFTAVVTSPIESPTYWRVRIWQDTEKISSNKSSILLDYTYSRIWLNQFEMFV